MLARRTPCGTAPWPFFGDCGWDGTGEQKHCIALRCLVVQMRALICHESGEDSGDPDVFDWPQFKSMLADAARNLGCSLI